MAVVGFVGVMRVSSSHGLGLTARKHHCYQFQSSNNR
jgi:hypothetical protein